MRILSHLHPLSPSPFRPAPSQRHILYDLAAARPDILYAGYIFIDSVHVMRPWHPESRYAPI